MNDLVIKNLYVSVAKDASTPSPLDDAWGTPPRTGGEILKGVTLTIKRGEVHVLMGPNGSGKSTLAMTLMGHPAYTVMKGSVMYQGKNVLKLAPEARAKLGMFLSFQHPVEAPGVPFGVFLRDAYESVKLPKRPISVAAFDMMVAGKAATLGLAYTALARNLNEGFSGGEKKRAEILQMSVLEPSMAILDETDSGLDVDAMRTVAREITALRSKRTGMLVITHYQRILKYLQPDVVHVMVGGRIVASGDRKLAMSIERRGYYSYLSKERL